QRDVLAHVVRAAEGEDLALTGCVRRQVRARGDRQRRGVAPGREILDRDRDALTRWFWDDEKGRQDAREQRQLHRRFGLGAPRQGFGAERALERGGEVERRISDRPRRGEVERLDGAN